MLLLSFLLKAISASIGLALTHTLLHTYPREAGSLSYSGTQRLAQLAPPEHTGHHLPPPVPISTHAHHIQIHRALLAKTNTVTVARRHAREPNTMLHFHREVVSPLFQAKFALMSRV